MAVAPHLHAYRGASVPHLSSGSPGVEEREPPAFCAQAALVKEF